MSAIESVIEQSHKDWLLWVVADNCILQNAWPMELDDRIIVYEAVTLPIRQDHGAYCRNYGIMQGNAEWIAYIDDDDLWRPNHLETIVQLAKDNPDATMIRTSGQSFKRSRKSPRSSKIVNKPGVINTTDILTVGMAHRRDLFERTPQWQACDNHDHILWSDMIIAGGDLLEDTTVTFDFQR